MGEKLDTTDFLFILAINKNNSLYTHDRTTKIRILVLIHSVQLLSRVWLFATPWIAARQASLSITNFQSLLKHKFIELVMLSNHLILCHPLLLLPTIPPSIRVFSNESTLRKGGQSIGVSASASVLPMNTEVWSPLGWTGWIPLQSKGLSRVFSNTTVQKHPFFSTQLSAQSNSHIHALLSSNSQTPIWVSLIVPPNALYSQSIQFWITGCN